MSVLPLEPASSGARVPVPPGWESLDHSEPLFVALEPSREGAVFRSNVVVTSDDLDGSPSLAEWVSLQITAQSDLPGYHELDSRGLDAAGDWASHLRCYLQTTEDGIPVVTTQWYHLRGPRGVTLTCTALSAEYDAFADLFEQIAQEIDLSGAATP